MLVFTVQEDLLFLFLLLFLSCSSIIQILRLHTSEA